MSLDVCQADQVVKYLAKTSCGNGTEQRRCADALIRLLADKAYETADERHEQLLTPEKLPPLSRATHYLGVRNIVVSTLKAYPEDAVSFLYALREAATDARVTEAFCAGSVVGVLEASGMVWYGLLNSDEKYLQFDKEAAAFLVSFLTSDVGKRTSAMRKSDASIFSSAVAEYTHFPLSCDDSESHLPQVRLAIEGLLKGLKPLRYAGSTATRLGDQFVHEASWKLLCHISQAARMNFVFTELGFEFETLPKRLA